MTTGHPQRLRRRAPVPRDRPFLPHFCAPRAGKIRPPCGAPLPGRSEPCDEWNWCGCGCRRARPVGAAGRRRHSRRSTCSGRSELGRYHISVRSVSSFRLGMGLLMRRLGWEACLLRSRLSFVGGLRQKCEDVRWATNYRLLSHIHCREKRIFLMYRSTSLHAEDRATRDLAPLAFDWRRCLKYCSVALYVNGWPAGLWPPFLCNLTSTFPCRALEDLSQGKLVNSQSQFPTDHIREAIPKKVISAGARR